LLGLFDTEDGGDYVPPKCQLTLNRLHGVISQKVVLFFILYGFITPFEERLRNDGWNVNQRIDVHKYIIFWIMIEICYINEEKNYCAIVNDCNEFGDDSGSLL
jgi:hypothetical protein